MDDEQPVHQLVDSYSHRAAKGGSKDDTLFVFLEGIFEYFSHVVNLFYSGFLKNHFCKVAAEKIDHETRRLCSESDSFTTEEPPPEVLENILEDHASSFVAVMRRLCRLKLLDSYRTGCYKIFKCCYEACYIIEEAYSLESLLKESFQASGIFNLLMSPFCTRFGDTFFQIIKALLIPLWNEDTFEWLVHHCLEKLDVMELRGIVGTTTSQLGIDTLRMLIIVYNSTCFLLEPLRMRRKEMRVYDSAEVSDDSSLLAQLNKITNICMKIFA